MAVSSRKVQNKRDSNGVLTGKAGTVYDVNIKYTGQDGKKKSYAKKGFATKKEATQHEAEMKAKLANPVYSPVVASQGKQTVKEYLEEWVENHGKANLRPSTFAGYKSHIRNHIVPYIGHVQLNQLTPAMLDNMFQQLFEKGLWKPRTGGLIWDLPICLDGMRKQKPTMPPLLRNGSGKLMKGGRSKTPVNSSWHKNDRPVTIPPSVRPKEILWRERR